jgi:hypothetical protein
MSRFYPQDDRSSKAGQFSPQRFDGSLKDTSRYTGTASPTKPPGNFGGSSPFSGQQTLQGTGYDPVDELALGMRGMVVEDDYGSQNAHYRQTNGQQSQYSVPQIRAPPQGRSPYNGYPQPEYATAYYAGGSYPYDAYRNGSDPSVYASSPAMGPGASPQAMYPGPQNLHPELPSPHSGVFYDYNGSARQAGSPYFYPAQPMMYHAAPSPMLNPATPSMNDKKRELQMGHQNMVYGASMRSTPSPHPQGYPVEYGSPMMMVPGLFPQGAHVYQRGPHPGRRDAESAPLRSALLEDFRTNKTRKWELRVSQLLPSSLLMLIPLSGYLWIYRGIQRRPARFSFHPTEA